MTRRPRFSVIVPTRERPDQLLPTCLVALASLDYPADEYEVVVSVDGEGRPAEAELRRFAGDLHLEFVTQPRSGPAAARNAGARRARGTFLAFTDDDCAPASDWLRRLEERLEADGRRVVGGRTVNGLAANAYSSASQLVIDALYEHYHEHENRGRFFTSNNVALAAEDFLGVGGFDESFPLAAAEDREFAGRCLRLGYTLVYAPDAVVVHRHDLGFQTFCHQHFTYGRGAVHLRSALRSQGLERESVERGFYRRLLRVALRAGGPLRRVQLALLVVVSQWVYALGAAREAVATRLRSGRIYA